MICLLPVVLLPDVSAKGVISVGRESPKCCLPSKTVGAEEKSNRMRFGPDKVTVKEGAALRRRTHRKQTGESWISSIRGVRGHNEKHR